MAQTQTQLYRSVMDERFTIKIGDYPGGGVLDPRWQASTYIDKKWKNAAQQKGRERRARRQGPRGRSRSGNVAAQRAALVQRSGFLDFARHGIFRRGYPHPQRPRSAQQPVQPEAGRLSLPVGTQVQDGRCVVSGCVEQHGPCGGGAANCLVHRQTALPGLSHACFQRATPCLTSAFPRCCCPLN